MERGGPDQFLPPVATAAERGAVDEVPEDTRPQRLPDPHAGKEEFLDLCGRPQRESACECERRTDLSLPQALNLVNGGDIATAIADPKGRIAKMITEGASDRQMVEEFTSLR